MFLRHQNPFIHGGELNPLDAGKDADGGGRCLQQSSTGVVKGLRMMRMGGRGDTGQWHRLTKYIYIL